MDNRAPILAAMVLAVASCSDPLTDSGEAQIARAHLENVLRVMEEHSINRNTIDWTAFRARVNAEVPNPKRVDDTFAGIELALGLLGDDHSTYLSPPPFTVPIHGWTTMCGVASVPQPSVPDDIGYLRVAAGAGASRLGDEGEARSMQSIIELRDGASLRGWIVDLRGNGFFNLWPIIAGLGPIFGDATLGWFVDADGTESRLEYRDGKAILGGTTRLAVTSPVTLTNGGRKVAVLLDGRVASAGEAAAIAFKGAPNTRFFGTQTCGKSTAIEQFNTDGAILRLAVARIIDRNKVPYTGKVQPDETIPDAVQLLQRAIEWIRSSGNG